MNENKIAFIIWTVIALLFIMFGFICYFSKRQKAFNFWANAKISIEKDAKKYNKALGKLWCVYGILLGLLGMPLLNTDHEAAVIISVLGTMIISIGAMIVYTVGIEPKYRKK